MKRMLPFFITLFMIGSAHAYEAKTDIQFTDKRVSELVQIMTELTGHSFVFAADQDRTISWSQKQLRTESLMIVFQSVLENSGYNCQLIVGENPYYLVTDQGRPPAAGSGRTAVGYYRLRYVDPEMVVESIDALYGEAIKVVNFGSETIAFYGSNNQIYDIQHLLGQTDKPDDEEILQVRLKYISVREGMRALEDMKVLNENTYWPSYWQRSIVVTGTKKEKFLAAAALRAIDKQQIGWLDEVYHLHTTDSETVVQILNATNGNCQVRKIGEMSVLISGNNKDVEKATTLLKKIDGTGYQVRIEAVVAYLTDKEFKELGTQLKTVQGGFGFAMNRGLIPTTSGTLIEWFEESLGITLSAEKNKSKGEIVTSPVMTVLNGQSARLHVGRNVPYLSRANYDSYDGSEVGTSIERQDVGLTFAVRPIVDPSGDFVTVSISNILSSITPESELGQTFVDVVVDKQEVTSDVRVANGQTIFLGGLRSEEKGHSREDIPLLSEIPVLGPLMFSYDSEKIENRNLVVSLRVEVLG